MGNKQILNNIDKDELLNHILELSNRLLQYVDIYPSAKAQTLMEIGATESAWIERKIHEKDGEFCPYCDGAEPLVIGNTDDCGIMIKQETGNTGQSLIAYGYDVHGSGTNGLAVKINYCPVCGKRLRY